MAITKVAQFVTPPVDVDDYDAQNAHIAGFTRQLAGPSMALTEWENTTTIPKLALGTYLSHGGYLYRVDTEDYVISSTPTDGTWYIRLEASGDTLVATWISSVVGYAWNAVYNGLYNSTYQLLPYQVGVSGTASVYVKRKIVNPYTNEKFFTVDYGGNTMDFNLAVTGNATVGGTLGVTDNATVDGTLGVTGAISGASINTSDGDFKIGQNLRPADPVSFGAITAPTIDTGNGVNEVFKQSYEAYTISSDTTMNSMIVGETRWTTVYESDESYLKLPSGGTYLIIGTDRRDANGITSIGSWIEPDLMSGGERISSYQDGYNFYSMFIIRRIS